VVPSLHVLCHKVQSTGDTSPTEELATVRDDLIKWIADEALGGDEVAAQWLVLELSAKVSVFPLSVKRVCLIPDTATHEPHPSYLRPSLCPVFLHPHHHRPHYLPFTMYFLICYRSILPCPSPWIFLTRKTLVLRARTRICTRVICRSLVEPPYC
jgi:hypothetical protein